MKKIINAVMGVGLFATSMIILNKVIVQEFGSYWNYAAISMSFDFAAIVEAHKSVWLNNFFTVITVLVLAVAGMYFMRKSRRLSRKLRKAGATVLTNGLIR